MELSNEKEEYYIETMRLKQVVTEVRVWPACDTPCSSCHLWFADACHSCATLLFSFSLFPDSYSLPVLSLSYNLLPQLRDALQLERQRRGAAVRQAPAGIVCVDSPGWPFNRPHPATLIPPHLRPRRYALVRTRRQQSFHTPNISSPSTHPNPMQPPAATTFGEKCRASPPATNGYLRAVPETGLGRGPEMGLGPWPAQRALSPPP